MLLVAGLAHPEITAQPKCVCVSSCRRSEEVLGASARLTRFIVFSRPEGFPEDLCANSMNGLRSFT